MATQLVFGGYVFSQDDDDDDDDDDYYPPPAPPAPPENPAPPEGGDNSGDNGGQDDGSGFSTGPADPGTGDDPINDATGGRNSSGTDLQLATSDPTRETDSTWGTIFGTQSSENSCLCSSETDSFSPDVHDATEAPTDESSFWSDSWFNFSHSFVIGDPSNGMIQTDVELGSAYGTVWMPVEGEGGVFVTEGITNEGNYTAVGAYLGLPSEAEVFGQTELSNPAPNIEFGARLGGAEFSVGVDASPMVESGGRALENLEQNLYEFYSNPLN
jgi:hypothetical protein